MRRRVRAGKCAWTNVPRVWQARERQTLARRIVEGAAYFRPAMLMPEGYATPTLLAVRLTMARLNEMPSVPRFANAGARAAAYEYGWYGECRESILMAAESS